ncbi:MAG: hypothetical protein IRY85_17595 [Micromonosporaceae bacterium]|nr:hypothetical protein [Micromonosporaceae bacterium]
MIVGSVLLVVVAGVLLGVGLVRLDATLLYSSIGVSALAALTLAVGVRRAATIRAGQGTIAVRPVVPAPRPMPSADRVAPRPVGRARVVTAPDADDSPVPSEPSVVVDSPAVLDSPVMDESTPEVVGERDLARVARLDVIVLVDERPWFHRVDCADLFGRTAEQLSVVRAIELGAAPCGRCRPVTTLLADMDPAAGGPGD